MQKALYTHLKTLPLYQLFQLPEATIAALAFELNEEGILSTYHKFQKGTNHHERTISNSSANGRFLHVKPLLQKQAGAKGQPAYH